MPKELEKTQAPSTDTYINQLNLIMKHKATNWYNWNIKNWGTKWDVEIECIEKNDYELHYGFDSAWSPPIEGIRKISELFPNLTFFLEYEEGGIGFKGITKIKNGTADDKCFNY